MRCRENKYTDTKDSQIETTLRAVTVSGMNRNIILSSRDFFSQEVELACQERKVEAYPQVKSYLVELLEFYLDARNLHEDEKDELGRRRPTTLSEMFLVAQNSDPITRFELLKKLGDRTLYLSGFFSESLARKIIDVDYYVEMGGLAYDQLSNLSKQDTLAKVYSVFSQRFIQFSDVLQHISQKNQKLDDQGILKLYDRYLKTGSDYAKEELLKRGVLPISAEQRKTHKLS